MAKLVAQNNITIYEVARDRSLYNLPQLLDAADLALEVNETNLIALRGLLKSSDIGLRYWGIVGCFLLNDTQSALQCLEDDSHEVRAMAGWLLLRSGDKKNGAPMPQASPQRKFLRHPFSAQHNRLGRRRGQTITHHHSGIKSSELRSAHAASTTCEIRPEVS